MVKVPKGYRSKNVEDRRGAGRGRGGGGFGFPRRGGSRSGGGLGGGGLGGSLGGGGGLEPSLGGATGTGLRSRKGCGGGMGMLLLIAIPLLLFMCSGGGGGTDIGMGDLATGPAPVEAPVDAPAYTDAEDLVNFILDDVQVFWDEEFRRAGLTYPISTLVLFEDRVSTDGCGNATAQVGPFYCPADSKAYIDLGFMLLLQDRLGAEGDFSQAYILAHEIGHHVQNVLGTNQAVREEQARNPGDANQLSVRLELQADCLAGMWARNAEQRGLLEAGDLREGVEAAEAVGDDAISGNSRQENFTHGTSEQRVRWFSAGFDTGEYDSCNTFNQSYGDL